MRPVSYSSFAEERRTLPLEVFGTPRGGTSTMSSAAEPAIAVTTSCAAAISLARASALVSLVSAITIRRSVPFCGSGEPNAATPPLRMPGIAEIASSISCG